MKQKNITLTSSRLLAGVSTAGKNWFTIGEVYDLFPNVAPKSLSQQLMRMVDTGLLLRVKDGIYYTIPFETNSATYMPDWHLLAEPLAGNEHYVGYYSALQLHQLITQPALTEQIVVKKQIKPSIIELRKVKFQFIYYNDKHFFGYKRVWINDFDRVLCSDLEKTIIDCLYKLEYACGITEVAKALYMAKNRIDYEQLLKYAVQFNCQAVIKRLGYLLELWNIDTPIIAKLQKIRTNTLTLLDIGIPKRGKICTRWSILQNIDIQTIKSSITT